MPDLSVSIVSHRQAALVHDLLNDLQQHCPQQDMEVLLTLNLEESLPFDPAQFSFQLRVLRNISPKGFGANHNAAFAYAKGAHFCILNPDIRLHDNPFPTLLHYLDNHNLGLIAPMVLSPEGACEDSARRFPRPGEIIAKVFGGQSATIPPGKGPLTYPDWLAGMFLLLPSTLFRRLHGFDERYFLYYEDVDLCARLKLAGERIARCNEVKVVHAAQRSSHRNLRYLRMHLGSMLRFFTSDVFRRLP